jgi:hypothetical protein
MTVDTACRPAAVGMPEKRGPGSGIRGPEPTAGRAARSYRP